MDHTEKFTDMNTFNLVKRYRKPLVEIDEKIDRLEEAMTTSGLYSRVQQDSGQDFIPPTMGNATLGDAGQDNFQWPDQGDGSDGDANPVTSSLITTDTLGREIAKYGYLPGVIYHDGDERRDPDYSNYGGEMPLAILYDSRALASTRFFWLGKDGLHFIMQIGAYTTPGPYTDLQTAFHAWYSDIGSQNLSVKTVYIWGGLQVLLGQYYGASQYYPSGRDTTTDPVADRGLYAYSMYVPGTGNPNFATDPGQRSLPPRVTNIISRDNLGDPTYYPGEIAGITPLVLQEMLLELQKGALHPGDRNRIIDALDKWAKPGSPNRMKLKNMGIPLV